MRAMTAERPSTRWAAAGLMTLLVAPGVAIGAVDETLQREVERRLSKKDAIAARVDVTVVGDEVTLDGTVATLWEKEWAIDRAKDTKGVAHVMSNLLIGRPETDAELAGAVGNAIVRYPYYTVFDYVSATVMNGVVTLNGVVTPRPDKPADLYERVSKVRGVQAIVNELDVLSPGIGDERLRGALARQMFGHPLFDRYRSLTPGFSIIVRNGYVTLKGVVFDQGDKILAESIARRTFGVIRVHNELVTREELLEVTQSADGVGAGD